MILVLIHDIEHFLHVRVVSLVGRDARDTGIISTQNTVAQPFRCRITTGLPSHLASRLIRFTRASTISSGICGS